MITLRCHKCFEEVYRISVLPRVGDIPLANLFTSLHPDKYPDPEPDGLAICPFCKHILQFSTEWVAQHV